MKKKNSFGRQLLLYVVLFGVIIVMLSSLFYKDTKGTVIDNYSELATYIKNNEVNQHFIFKKKNQKISKDVLIHGRKN